ncbi:MAG: hypothetical protein WCX74_04055 [Candidatus Paceibacterota bacterium]
MEEKIYGMLPLCGEKKFERIVPFLEKMDWSFDGLLELFSSSHKAIRAYAFKKMLEFEFPDLKKLLQKKLVEEERKQIFEKIASLAETFEEYHFLYSECKDEDDLRSIAFEKMLTLAFFYEEWLYIYHIAPRSFKEFIMKNLISLAEISQLFDLYGMSDTLKEKIFGKMEKCGPSVEWLRIYIQTTDQRIEELAFEKAKEYLKGATI